MFYCGIDIAKRNHEASVIDAVARKMCNIIFTILKENRPYEAMPPKKRSAES